MNIRTLVFSQTMTMEDICREGNQYMETVWRSLYEAMHEQLTGAFDEIGDAAYGLYLDQLMPKLFDGLADAGFEASEPVNEQDFVIGKRLIFRNSLEKWGPEEHRSRIFWNCIRNKHGQSIGTLLTEIPHSHLKFDIPSAPVLYALQETDRKQIIQGIRRIKQDAGGYVHDRT